MMIKATMLVRFLILAGLLVKVVDGRRGGTPPPAVPTHHHHDPKHPFHEPWRVPYAWGGFHEQEEEVQKVEEVKPVSDHKRGEFVSGCCLGE